MRAILYSFRRCPYAMRARLAIQVANIKVELREVVLKHKPAELLQASPKATVPVLVLPDEKVIDESRDIMMWALAQNDPQGWLVAAPEIPVNELIAFNDEVFKVYLDGYKYADRHPEPAEFYRQQGEVFLQQLEYRLAQHPYLFGDRVSLADMAVFPFIRQFAHVDLDWFNKAGYSRLRHWLNGFLNAAWFTHAMKKYPAWQSGEPAQQFP